MFLKFSYAIICILANYLTFYFHTACTTPPLIVDGAYNEVPSDKYVEGEKVYFTCDKTTYLAEPKNGEIVCGHSDWDVKATCTRSWFISCTYIVFVPVI